MNYTCSLIERRVEPLDNLKKCFTVRNMRGLPFNVPYACTGMQEFGNLLFLIILSQSIHTPLCPQSLTLPEGAPPGLTHLTYRWRARASERRKRNTSEANEYALVCMF